MFKASVEGDVTVTITGHPDERFKSVEAMQEWYRRATGQVDIRMVTFCGCGTGDSFLLEFDEADTIGTLYQNNGVLGFNGAGDRSVEVFEKALRWYQGERTPST